MTFKEKLTNFAPVAEMMPGVVVVHHLEDFSPVYMSSQGLKLLGLELQELIGLGKEYTPRFFNVEDMQPLLMKLKKMLEDNDAEQTFTFVHQIKLPGSTDWSWYISSITVFHQDMKGSPTHSLAVAFPLDQSKKATSKAERLLAESKFARENFSKYGSLGKRGREVLRLVAIGKSSAEISGELNISLDTVNSHRRIIKEKLKISTAYEFTEYAFAFDLI